MAVAAREVWVTKMSEEVVSRATAATKKAWVVVVLEKVAFEKTLEVGVEVIEQAWVVVVLEKMVEVEPWVVGVSEEVVSRAAVVMMAKEACVVAVEMAYVVEIFLLLIFILNLFTCHCSISQISIFF